MKKGGSSGDVVPAAGRRPKVLLWSLMLAVLTSCGVNSNTQFGAGDAQSRSTESPPQGDSSPTARYVSAPDPETPPPAEPPSAPAPAEPRESDPITPPVPIAGPAGTLDPIPPQETAPADPPVAIAGAFLLECSVSPEVPYLPSVVILCRILKNGVLDTTGGTKSIDWAIESQSSPGTWGPILGLRLPSISGLASVDFVLDRTTYVGRKVRVRHPLFGTTPSIPPWLETTLSGPSGGGGLMLTGLGGVADLRGIHLGNRQSPSVLLGDPGDAPCPTSIADSPISGLGVRFTFTVTSKTASVVLSLRGLCGINSTQTQTKTPFLLTVKAQGAGTSLFRKSLGEGDATFGPLSLPKGTYEISFESAYLPNFPSDRYDNVGFSSMLIMPAAGEMSTPQAVFF